MQKNAKPPPGDILDIDKFKVGADENSDASFDALTAFLTNPLALAERFGLSFTPKQAE